MWNSIVESFTGLTPILWVGQICSFIGLIIHTISYQCKKDLFYLFLSISCMLYVVETSTAGFYSAAIVCFITSIRFFINFIYERQGKGMLPDKFVYQTIILEVVGILVFMTISKSFNDWTNYVPLVLAVFYGLIMNNKHLLVVKVGAFINEFAYLIFYIIEGLPVSTIREIVLSTSCLISVIVLIHQNHKNKKEKQKNC